MLMTFLNVLFFLTCFLLVIVVLLQSGKGGGLAAGFGGSGTGFEVLGGRQTATFLHRATTWLGGAFLAIAFAIALLTAHGNRPGSLRDVQAPPRPVQQEGGAPQDLQSVVQPKSQPEAGAPASAPAGAPGTAAPPAAAGPAGGTAAPAPPTPAGAAPAGAAQP
jgi:preprotein translocase subunit SecG